MVEPGSSGGGECDAARVEINAFLSSTSRGAKSPNLRAHLARCVECNAHYRELVVGIARIASGARTAADQRQVDELQTSARRSLIAAETRHRIKLPKTLLPLAIVALVAIIFAKGGAQGVTLSSLEGTVYRGAQLVAAGERVSLANGDGCSTSAGGRGELRRGDDCLRIDPESSFTIERLDRLAVRLFDGGVSAEGAALIVFTTGVLEVTDGAANVRVDDVAIRIESLRGRVEFTDATGRTTIPPDTHKTIEHPHYAASH